MSVPKVCGIETEYGISLRGAADPNPVFASSVLINAYVDRDRVGWDFEDETPGQDARGSTATSSRGPEVETHLVNTVLTNGARYYVDHAHPEYSTPECLDAREVLIADKAGERILAQSMIAAQGLLESGQEIVVYKNNSDGKGNSYGTHENYLINRNIPFAGLVRHLIPWFVTRQIFTGAGKVGSENGAPDVDFQISQRADFFEEEVGLETTLKRPIINTRDEPHADPQFYRRLHVIVGDANLCEVAGLLKVGTTAIVLAMIEDDFFGHSFSPKEQRNVSLAAAVPAMTVVSHDPSCTQSLELLDGFRMTPLEIQWEYFRLAQKYADEVGLDNCGGVDVGETILQRWEQVLSALERDPMSLNGQLDWVTKYALLEAYRDRDNLEWGDPKLALLDLQYHDVRPARSLYERLVASGTVERILSEDEILLAVGNPPTTTRAYFRGKCLSRWPKSVVAANWDSIILDVGTDPLKRIPMMEPLKGTKEHVGALLDEVKSPAELITRLAALGK